jgi:hypothetical protein
MKIFMPDAAAGAEAAAEAPADAAGAWLGAVEADELQADRITPVIRSAARLRVAFT